MYIRLLMYPVQMPSLMYLLFAQKQRIRFLTHWVGGWAKFLTLIVINSANHWAPFPGLLCKTGSCQDSIVLFYSAAFSPTNKMYFICGKENGVFTMMDWLKKYIFLNIIILIRWGSQCPIVYIEKENIIFFEYYSSVHCTIHITQWCLLKKNMYQHTVKELR